jgi:hypothetical protein
MLEGTEARFDPLFSDGTFLPLELFFPVEPADLGAVVLLLVISPALELTGLLGPTGLFLVISVAFAVIALPLVISVAPLLSPAASLFLANSLAVDSLFLFLINSVAADSAVLFSEFGSIFLFSLVPTRSGVIICYRLIGGCFEFN